MSAKFPPLSPDELLILEKAFEIIEDLIFKPLKLAILDQYYCVDIQSPPVTYTFNNQVYSAKILICSLNQDGSGPFTNIPYVTVDGFNGESSVTPTFTPFQFQTAGVVPGAFGDDPTDPDVRFYQTVTVVPNVPSVSTFRHRLCGTPPPNATGQGGSQIPASALIVQKDAIVNANGITDPEIILPARYVHRTLNASGTAIDPNGPADLFIQKPFC